MISVPYGHALVWCNRGSPCECTAHFSPKCIHEVTVVNTTCFPAPSWSIMRKCDGLQCDIHLFWCHGGAERAGGAAARGGGGDGGRRGRRQARCRRSGDGRYSDRAGRRQAAPHTDAAPRRNPPEPAVRRTSGHALGSALTECAGRGMPPPLAEPARGGGMTGDGLAPDGNLAIAERGEDAARRPPPRAGEVAAAFPAP